jgi:hypothetical protein
LRWMAGIDGGGDLRALLRLATRGDSSGCALDGWQITVLLPVSSSLLTWVQLSCRLISVQLHHYWLYTIAVALIIALAARLYHRSLAEALGVLLAISLFLGLFFLPSVGHLPAPSSLQLANRDENKITEWIYHDWRQALLIAIVVISVFELNGHGIAETISTLTAVAVAIALLPYVININPLPKRPEYYFAVLHRPWLPAETITLSSGEAYSAYVLASDDNWFTVLTTSTRSVVYIPTDQIVRRTVCEVYSRNQPTEYPPLVTSLYSAPAHVRACARHRPKL